MWLLTLRSLLVAADLEDGALPALRTASRLASLSGAEIHLLHVADAPPPDAAARLEARFAAAAPDGPTPASVQVLPGSPASVIVEEAAALAADAVVLGPHRRGEGEMGEMGSTAASVVRNAPCPCLVAATELRLPLERVLAPIDGSEAARGTLGVATTWASALRPREGRTLLTALHVAEDPSRTEIPREILDQVEWARGRVEYAPRVEVREQIVAGADPADVILREAGSGRADLLVIGTREATLRTDGLGSVTAAVARATRCPLLLVPPEVSAALGGER